MKPAVSEAQAANQKVDSQDLEKAKADAKDAAESAKDSGSNALDAAKDKASSVAGELGNVKITTFWWYVKFGKMFNCKNALFESWEVGLQNGVFENLTRFSVVRTRLIY